MVASTPLRPAAPGSSGRIRDRRPVPASDPSPSLCGDRVTHLPFTDDGQGLDAPPIAPLPRRRIRPRSAKAP